MKIDIQFKLLLPTLATWGFLYGLFNYYLIPVLLDNEKQSYIDQQINQIHFLVEGIIQSIEESDFSHVYSQFGHALHHRPEWIELTLWDASNNLIYPLELPSKNTQDSILHVSYLHDDPGEAILNVKLITNTSDLLEKQNDLIYEFNILFLLLFGLTVASSYFFQQRLITKPINKLLEATKNLSRKNFSIELQVQSNDEIGDLFRSFTAMQFDLKNYQEQLQKAKEKAEESLSVKTRFIANISHELKTPLNIIMGNCQLMEIDVKNNSKIDLNDIHAAIQSCKHLNSLIEDILTMSKIDTNHVELKLVKFPLAELINEITTEFAPFIEKNQNQFEKIFSPEINNVTGDKTKIKQLFYNVINNANKFTSNGTISITTKLHNNNDITYVQVSIKDTGIGIDKNNHQKIFMPFVQIDSALNRQYDGSGLGLAICSDLCKLMQGYMEIESELGQGATFTIYLPLKMETL